ncbi:unnamed protein product, partial [Scytosiphon promiscuus]
RCKPPSAGTWRASCAFPTVATPAPPVRRRSTPSRLPCCRRTPLLERIFDRKQTLTAQQDARSEEVRPPSLLPANTFVGCSVQAIDDVSVFGLDKSDNQLRSA